MIALIDYGAGNLTSVKKALAAIGADVFVPDTPASLTNAHGVIVPGVGHFGATRALDRAWTDAILGIVGEGRPLLGICLGMQWLFEGSDEAPESPGLGVLSGRCFRLSGTPTATAERGEGVPAEPYRGVGAPGVIKVPHVGWNSIERRQDASIIEGVADGAQVYFTHSYVAPVTGDTVAATSHGEAFASVVQRGQIAGVQFHPEKSGDVGLQVLRNFVRLAG
jgi:glutamine amidotransferase